MFALTRLRSWTVLDEDRRIRADVALDDLAANLVAGLEERHNISVTAVLDAKTEDMARRILGSRLLKVEATDDSDVVRITIGYDRLDAARQLLQFSDHIEITDPPEARTLIAGLAEAIVRRHRGTTSE